MQVHNKTPFNPANIKASWRLVGRMRNEWRQRDVELYRAPTDILVSIGVAFDKSEMVIAEEQWEDWLRTMEVFPKTLLYK
jgi:hypothetical protein